MGWRNPLEQSEFEVQVEAYNILKDVYPNVRGEFHFKIEKQHAARFDIAILNDDNSIDVIVEIKRANKRLWAKQKERYEHITKRPCVVVAGSEQAKDVVAKVEEARLAWNTNMENKT